MPLTTPRLSPARWAYLKRLPPNTARMVHVSAPMVPIFGDAGVVRYVVGHGATYRRPPTFHELVAKARHQVGY